MKYEIREKELDFRASLHDSLKEAQQELDDLNKDDDCNLCEWVIREV